MNKKLEQAILAAIATLERTSQELWKEYETLSEAACDAALSKEEFNTTSRILAEISGTRADVHTTKIRAIDLLTDHLKGDK